MGTWIRAFLSELNRYRLSFTRSLVWVIGLLAFTAVAIASFYPLPLYSQSDLTLFPVGVNVYNFFTNSYSSMMMPIVLLLSSLLISEDMENGTWNLTRSLRISRAPFLLAKFLWIMVYLIAGFVLSVFVVSLYVSSSLGHFSFSFLVVGIDMVLAYLFIIAFTALFGMAISSLFSKRVSAVLVSAAFYVFLTIVPANLYNTLFVHGPGMQDNIPGYDIGIPLVDKLVILLNPSFFQGAAASLMGMHSFGLQSNNNGIGSTSTVQFFLPLMFSSPWGYILPYTILAGALIIFIAVVLYVKGRLG